MPGRTLVIGDIHGALIALEQVLVRAKVTEKDKLIFLGDYVDGWSDAPAVIDKLLELRSTNDCVFIRGNHDSLFYEWLTTHNHNELWLIHGGKVTVEAYSEIDRERTEIHKMFLESLDNYYHDSKNRLFVHAGFTNLHGVEREYFEEMLYWDRTLWEMAMVLDPEIGPDHPFYPPRLKHYHEIYIGHTPTIRIDKTVPVNFQNVWNIDTGAAYKSPLTIMDVDTKEFWQSDNVNTLYPDENGRN